MSVRALTVLAAIIASTILTLPASAVAKTLPVPPSQAVQPHAVRVVAKATKRQKKVQQAQLRRAAKQIGELRRLTWSCQDTLIEAGIRKHRTEPGTSIWALPPSVVYRTKFVAPKWIKLAKGCDKTLKEHTIPFTYDWTTAVQITQKVYPGTADVLMKISRHEGGRGPWVWYSGACSDPPCLWHGYHVGGDNVSGADTVGGWLQFRWSTFSGPWREMQEDLHRRGFILPKLPMPAAGGDPMYVGWLNPLGQALTAGYMFHYGLEGCHWCGAY